MYIMFAESHYACEHHRVTCSVFGRRRVSPVRAWLGANASLYSSVGRAPLSFHFWHVWPLSSSAAAAAAAPQPGPPHALWSRRCFGCTTRSDASSIGSREKCTAPSQVPRMSAAGGVQPCQARKVHYRRYRRVSAGRGEQRFQAAGAIANDTLLRDGVHGVDVISMLKHAAHGLFSSVSICCTACRSASAS
eukprot:39704-Chlamydomonas_euryale.AAC.3